jgi:putative phosphoesterase
MPQAGRVYRVGVLSDTHVPDYMPALPPAIAAYFAGVDLILHAGDVTSPAVLEELAALAPAVAVRGNHDSPDLPMKRLIEIGGARIGLIHGHRSLIRALPGLLANELSGGRLFPWGGALTWVRGAFDQADMIIFGHFHRPYLVRHQSVQLFSPGGVYQPTPARLQARLAASRSRTQQIYLRRQLDRLTKSATPAGPPPTIGLLTITDGQIEAQILPLPDTR